MPSDPFDRLEELAGVLPTSTWMLVGGLMVHCHAERAALRHARPTDDADLVVELRIARYGDAARALEGLGYARHLSLDAAAPLHRFTRGGDEHVDLMVEDEADVRFSGRQVLAVPGARSALRRTVAHEIGSTTIRLPDLGSALSLKGAAYRQPGPNRVRHLQDAVTLFACAGQTDLALSRSMRANVNVLVGALDVAEAWSLVGQPERRKAVRAVQQVRPDWQPPSFVLPVRRRT